MRLEGFLLAVWFNLLQSLAEMHYISYDPIGIALIDLPIFSLWLFQFPYFLHELGRLLYDFYRICLRLRDIRQSFQLPLHIPQRFIDLYPVSHRIFHSLLEECRVTLQHFFAFLIHQHL